MIEEREVVSDDDLLVTSFDSDKMKEMSGLNLKLSDMDKLMLETGRTFISIEVYRDALRLYVLREGIQPHYLRSYKDKVTIVCKKGCD